MELFGEFKYEERSEVYKCNVTKVINWKVGNGVLRTVGEHIEDRTNENLEAISFRELKIERFPRQLELFFPNLKALTINSCGLQSIQRSDLKGLSQLKQLTLNGNEISSLPDDLFDDTPGIETISFYGNTIRFIGMNTLKALRNLQYANFKMNSNIDDCYKTIGEGITLHELHKIISKNCQPKFDGIIENFLHDLVKIYSSLV